MAQVLADTHDSALAQIIGIRVRRWREEQRLTQRQLSKLVDMSVSSVSRIELGEQELTVRLVERIASVMGTSVPALCGGQDNQSAKAS